MGSAQVPGSFLNEGGQSAAGKLLDFVTESHAAWPELEKRVTPARFFSRTNPFLRFLNCFVWIVYGVRSRTKTHASRRKKSRVAKKVRASSKRKRSVAKKRDEIF